MTTVYEIATNREERLEQCQEMLEAATARYDSAVKALETARQRVKAAHEEYVCAQIAVDRYEELRECIKST